MWHNIGFGDTRLSTNANVMQQWHDAVVKSDRFLGAGSLEHYCAAPAASMKKKKSFSHDNGDISNELRLHNDDHDFTNTRRSFSRPFSCFGSLLLYGYGIIDVVAVMVTTMSSSERAVDVVVRGVMSMSMEPWKRDECKTLALATSLLSFDSLDKVDAKSRLHYNINRSFIIAIIIILPSSSRCTCLLCLFQYLQGFSQA